ncbi:MAG: protein phosphatase 2C domain-containing protein [Bacilli bacterium]|nr:protein phosphatase 2C domain-containing protein [Bacilli bacterium]
MEKLLDKAIIGYKLNHPKENIEEEITSIIIDEIQSIINGIRKENDIIFSLIQDNFFSGKIRNEINKKTSLNIEIKDILKTIYENYISNLDDIDFFNFSKKYAIFRKGNQVYIISHINVNELKYIDNIQKIRDNKDLKINFYEIFSKGNYKIDDIEIEVDFKGDIKVESENVIYGEINNPNHLKETKNVKYLMYKLTPIIIKILEKEDQASINVIQDIDNDLIEKSIKELMKMYIKKIDVTEVLKDNDFIIPKSTYRLLTNIKSFKLMDDFHGNLLEGKIKLATNRGYQTRPEKPQQDAVLSIVKNENCYLNMIADGAGGSEKGEKASKLLTEEIKNWFEVLPDEILNDTEIIIELLKQKITQIDSLIYKKYKGSCTTLVLAFTIKDITIIANIGDSTAYTYENDELICLTTLDSESSGMDYEDARFNPLNNVITAAVGAGFNDPLHINIIQNKGQRIILSSDGITDLICERRFKLYFINGDNPKQMINDALSKKDTEYLEKTEDNISVITIELPNTKNKTKKLG